MDKLITSSPTTIRWLNIIRSELEKRCPSLGYKETKHYAPFFSPEKNKNIAQLNPQPNQIRVFLRLVLFYDSRLQPTPSTSGYAKTYPSLFVVKDEGMIEKAIELIISSYKYDNRQQEIDMLPHRLTQHICFGLKPLPFGTLLPTVAMSYMLEKIPKMPLRLNAYKY